MKTLVLLGAFISTMALAGEPAAVLHGPGGTVVEFQLVTRIETNKPAPAGLVCVNGFACVTNVMTTYWYREPIEKPFPRTSSSDEVFDVVSNTYCNAVFDGKTTNTISMASTKLGTLKRNTSTVITTQTNCVTSESFSPQK